MAPSLPWMREPMSEWPTDSGIAPTPWGKRMAELFEFKWVKKTIRIDSTTYSDTIWIEANARVQLIGSRAKGTQRIVLDAKHPSGYQIIRFQCLDEPYSNHAGELQPNQVLDLKMGPIYINKNAPPRDTPIRVDFYYCVPDKEKKRHPKDKKKDIERALDSFKRRTQAEGNRLREEKRKREADRQRREQERRQREAEAQRQRERAERERAQRQQAEFEQQVQSYLAKGAVPVHVMYDPGTVGGMPGSAHYGHGGCGLESSWVPTTIVNDWVWYENGKFHTSLPYTQKWALAIAVSVNWKIGMSDRPDKRMANIPEHIWNACPRTFEDFARQPQWWC